MLASSTRTKIVFFRVMAPPGGASSNIFGVEPSYRTQGGDCAPKEPTPKAADTKNRLFGDEGASPAAAAAAESSPQPQAPPAGVNTHAGKRNHGTSFTNFLFCSQCLNPIEIIDSWSTVFKFH